MPSWKAFAAVLGLGAICFGLGGFFGSPPTIDELDLDESRSQIESAMRATDRLEQTALLVPIFQALDPANVEAIAKVFEANFAAGGGGLPLELFVASWARFDPQSCRRTLSDWPADMRRQAWPALLGTWAQSDPLAAVDALNQIPDAAVRQAALRPLIEGWGESGGAGIWTVLSEIPDPERRRELASVAVQRRMRLSGTEAVLGELEGLSDAAPTDRVKRVGLAQAAAIVARDDLPRAIALAEAHRHTANGREILRRVATHWASVDGPAAIAWVRAQPAGEPRDLALASAYRRWLQVDRATAADWVGEGALDADLTPIVITHAAALARQDPEAAVEWANAVQNPDTRRRSLAAVERIWRRSDPTAAAEWMERTGLSDESEAIPPPDEDNL